MIKSAVLYISFFVLIVLLVPVYLLGLIAQTINVIPRLYLQLLKATDEAIKRG